jgi:hypothetical protein
LKTVKHAEIVENPPLTPVFDGFSRISTGAAARKPASHVPQVHQAALLNQALTGSVS